MSKLYHIELTAEDVEVLFDMAPDSIPSGDYGDGYVEYHISRLEHDGLVERDCYEGWQLSNEGLYAYYACQEIQADSPICLFFTQDEVNAFARLSEEEQASWFPYVA